MNELCDFIKNYIAGRRQTKLEDFDKAMAKRLGAAATDDIAELQASLLQERSELEQRYQTRAWLTDAASRAGQLNFVTHAAKFTHGDSKSSSMFSTATACEGYLSTATLTKPMADAVGNSAALDIAKLLQTECNGESLLDYLQRGDASILATLAEDDNELAQWMAGFSCALAPKQLSSHKLAKQIFFPVREGYHLLSPLFSSSLAQALHQKMVMLRFSEESQAARKAQREKRNHHDPVILFPDTAVLNFGGTKPQNISALNSNRRGRVWLLSCAAPQWQNQDKPPYGIKTLFSRGQLDRVTWQPRRQLIDLLLSAGERKSEVLRHKRNRCIDQIIDTLFNIAADIQRPEWGGWTLNSDCQLKMHQRLWLDPWRAEQDAQFRLERENSDWQNAIAEDFALWLNGHLRHTGLLVGKVEQQAWQNQPLFRLRLREMEQTLRSYRHA